MFFLFLKRPGYGAMVPQFLISLYKSMVYMVAPLWHYSKRRKQLLLHMIKQMSKNSTIERGIRWSMKG
jgi:hypothetical protein